MTQFPHDAGEPPLNHHITSLISAYERRDFLSTHELSNEDVISIEVPQLALDDIILSKARSLAAIAAGSRDKYVQVTHDTLEGDENLTGMLVTLGGFGKPTEKLPTGFGETILSHRLILAYYTIQACTAGPVTLMTPYSALSINGHQIYRADE